MGIELGYRLSAGLESGRCREEKTTVSDQAMLP
jgi:hypothetical protein